METTQMVKQLGTLFQNLSKDQQDLVINYFNLHNAAIYLYNHAEQESIDYINQAIELSKQPTDVVDVTGSESEKIE